MAIGNLVANLSVNSEPWKKGLKGASGSMKSFVGGMSSIVAPLAGVLGVAFGASKSVEAFKAQNDAQKKLQAVITATGGAAGLTADDIGEMASRLQDVTNFGDEATIEAASLLATFKNIKGDTFERSIVAMQDMATVMGTDVSAGAVQMGKALNDPIKGAAALADVGVGFTDQQKEMIKTMQDAGDIAGAQGVILAELEGQFGGAAEAMVDPWTQAQNALGDVGEVIGAVLMPGINVVSGLLKDGANFVLQYKDKFVEWGNTARDVMETAFAVGKWSFNNLQAIGEVTYKALALAAVVYFNTAVHFWGTVLPNVVAWAWDNMGQIAFTGIDYTLTLFINLGKNIRAVWQAVLDFFTTGSFNVDWTPLLEGAKSTISKMPNIPERVIGDVEAALAADVAALQSTLSKSLDDTLDSLTPPEKAKQKSLAAQEGLATAPTAPTATDKAKETKSEQNFAGVIAAGSSEAFSLLAKSSQQQTPQVKEQKTTNKILRGMAKVAERQQQRNDKLEEVGIA